MRAHLVTGMVAYLTALLAVINGSTQRPNETDESRVVLDNATVQIVRTRALVAGDGRRSAVVIALEHSQERRAGDAFWLAAADGTERGDLIIVSPKARGADEVAEPASAGSAPGDATFVGMSFEPLFEDGRVSVIRARMEVGAREGFHTHGSDTIVVHLSGGTIEDTAEGVTTVNRWQPGDVEFEARGSSHSARNLDGAVDVVLIVLTP